MHYSLKKRSDRTGWQVIWYENSQRKRKNFSIKFDAETWQRDMQRLADAEVSSAELMAAKREAAGTGFALDELVRAGLEHFRGEGMARADAKMTFSAAGARVIDIAAKGGARERTISSYNRTYSTLNQAWGGRVASMLTENEVEKWLNALPDRRGCYARATISTKDTYLRHIRMAMRAAGVVNPLPNLAFAVDQREVEYFTVEECKLAFKSCPADAIGFLAVAMFVGIRPENLALLPSDAVSVAAKRIRVPGHISKDRLTHILNADVIPPVLWSWLERYPYQPTEWGRLQDTLRKGIGRWIQDGLRHTAATYYCSVHGVAATARLLMHQGERLVRKHYAGVVELNAAMEFAFGPDEVDLRTENDRNRAKVEWPSDAALKAMLESEPATKVAEQIGCSDSALGKRCKLRGIPKPSRGHWTKIQFRQSA